MKLEDDDYDSYARDDNNSSDNNALYGNYEHDWDISEEENQQQADEFYATQERLQQEESENAEANQEARWAAENEKDKAERSKKLLKTKLLMPLYVKKLAKKIGELTQKNQTCSNSVTVQAGQPEERASMRVYSQCTEDWKALNPPANTCTAAVVDFNLRDDYCEESLAGLQEMVAENFKKYVSPHLNEVNHLPKGMLQSGVVSGKPFDSYRFEPESVGGKTVLRLVVFSGVDALGGFGKLADTDISKLVPQVSAKLTTGFSLADLFTSGATLKDMLNFKAEVTLNYVKETIQLLGEVYQIVRKAVGQDLDEYDLKDLQKQNMALTAFCKFFVAQRSLFYFQFETPFDFIRQMIHEFGLPMFLEKIEKDAPPGLMQAPPTAEVVDAVLDAVGNITGATFGAMKAMFLKDGIVDMRKGHSPLYMLQKASRIAKAKQEVDERGADANQEAVLMVDAFNFACKFHKVVAGLASAKVVDQIGESGVELSGWDFMEFLPSPEDVENATAPTGEAPWFQAYAEKIQGNPDAKVDEAKIAGIKTDFAEIAAVVQAAWPLLECANMDMINEQTNGMASKLEDEAKSLFDIV